MGWDPGSWVRKFPNPRADPPPRRSGTAGPPRGPPPPPGPGRRPPPGRGGSGRVTRGRPDPPGGVKKPPKKGVFYPPRGGAKTGKMPPKKRELIVRLFGRGFCTFRGGCNFGGILPPEIREYPGTPPGGAPGGGFSGGKSPPGGEIPGISGGAGGQKTPFFGGFWPPGGVPRPPPPGGVPGGVPRGGPRKDPPGGLFSLGTCGKTGGFWGGPTPHPPREGGSAKTRGPPRGPPRGGCRDIPDFWGAKNPQNCTPPEMCKNLCRIV